MGVTYEIRVGTAGFDRLVTAPQFAQAATQILSWTIRRAYGRAPYGAQKRALEVST